MRLQVRFSDPDKWYRAFAVIPVRIGDVLVWLEFYEVRWRTKDERSRRTLDGKYEDTVTFAPHNNASLI